MTTEVIGRPERSSRLGIIAILVSVVPVIVFGVLLGFGFTTNPGFGRVLSVALYCFPATILISLALALLAIVFRAGRQLGYATIILLVPQAAFVVYGLYALFTIPQNGLL